MKLSARVRANRANAQRSTGPKTSDGKSRVAKNALRHGLAVPVELDAALAPEMECLTLAIAGKEADDEVRLEHARRIAEAQIDLIRIRNARLTALAGPPERVRKMRMSELRREIAAIKIRNRVDEATYRKRLKGTLDTSVLRFELDDDVDSAYEEMMELTDGPMLKTEQLTPDEHVTHLVQILARLDRYERRALSRRKTAMRAFDAMAL